MDVRNLLGKVKEFRVREAAGRILERQPDAPAVSGRWILYWIEGSILRWNSSR